MHTLEAIVRRGMITVSSSTGLEKRPQADFAAKNLHFSFLLFHFSKLALNPVSSELWRASALCRLLKSHKGRGVQLQSLFCLI